MAECPITFRCNNACVSCINDTNLLKRREDVTWKSIKLLINSLNPERDYLGLSGGEPTLSGNLLKAIRYAREKHPNIHIFLISNGRMLSYAPLAKKIVEAGKGNLVVAVALYGHNETLHDSITRSQGSFSQTVSGIRNLLNLGARVEVRVVINKINYKSLEEITKFVRKEFSGMERLVFINMKITGNALNSRDTVAVKISDVVPFMEKSIPLLEKSGIDTRLYHFPLCTIPERLWPMAESVTKQGIGELTFTDACNSCFVKDRCCRIWTSYLGVFGKDEFHPVKCVH